ncbi:probable cytochrome P450 6g2 [Scaptodrosophila lebanonensis]|uniref:Probable cytochrome P450 6g2 n=1 Tax=Drosophila lebanonensis TaxID=7225 RepID=A0A6J2TWQ4_DROLE|nr:probable cytochrome P450 6g2 [Scaptodrosophila lebanonensis]
MFVEHIIFLLLAGVLGAYYALNYHYNYWKRRKVSQIPPRFLLGNMAGILSMRRSPADFINDLYNNSSVADKPFVGIYVFHKPALLLREPALIKRIMVKDFSDFSNRYSNSDYIKDPLGSQNIFFLKNPAWKEVRLKLSPFFTSNKLRNMFALIEEIGCNLDTYLRNIPLENEMERSFQLEVKELCALFTTDVIASVAYGVQANSFKQVNSEFRRHGRAVFEFTFKRAVEFIMVFFLPNLVPFFGFKVVPVEAAKFLRSSINHILMERERTGACRNDLIDILIEFKRSNQKSVGSDHQKLIFEGDILVAQAVLFFTAGFESSSSTMAFALFELAKHTDVQQRLRAEIKEALNTTGGVLTHSVIDSLQYMQMVLYEVLRLYPPLPFLDRECTTVNGADQEGYSLVPFHETFHIPSGMPIYIPVYALHMDAQYYSRPKLFLPDRFSTANRKLHRPYTYLPFGAGPHGCIGERFALLQAKIGLVHLLRNHMVLTTKGTPNCLKLDPKALILQAHGGIHLKLVRDPLGI